MSNNFEHSEDKKNNFEGLILNLSKLEFLFCFLCMCLIDDVVLLLDVA